MDLAARAYHSAHRELRASPRKPKVATPTSRSEKSLILEVWCLSVSASKLSLDTPLPLSDTSTRSKPCSRKRTSEKKRFCRMVTPPTSHTHLITYVGCSCVQAVFHELFDRHGQAQHDLSGADLMDGATVDCLHSSRHTDDRYAIRDTRFNSVTRGLPFAHAPKQRAVN